MLTILRNFVSIFEDTGAILFDIYKKVILA